MVTYFYSTIHKHNIMSRFFSVEMASAVSKHPHVSIKKSLFGLFAKAYYNVTKSQIGSYENSYSRETGERIKPLFSIEDKYVIGCTKDIGLLHQQPNGNYRLDICISRDRQFIALQLFHFENLMYRPVTDVRYFEGEQAEAIEKLFA